LASTFDAILYPLYVVTNEKKVRDGKQNGAPIISSTPPELRSGGFPPTYEEQLTQQILTINISINKIQAVSFLGQLKVEGVDKWLSVSIPSSHIVTRS
jgi:hypothetical protein